MNLCLFLPFRSKLGICALAAITGPCPILWGKSKLLLLLDRPNEHRTPRDGARHWEYGK